MKDAGAIVEYEWRKWDRTGGWNCGIMELRDFLFLHLGSLVV